jgi:hypothetical protein
MNIHERFTPYDVANDNAPRLSWIKAIGARIATWFRTARDYHAAASSYEQLSGLSDAELGRRGLSRDTLARDLCDRFERSKD